MLKKILNNMTNQRLAEKRADLYRNLLRHEAQIGGQLFGAVPEGGRREFFCLDEHTWVWHEEWIDRNGQHQAKTTRYDIRPTGLMKVQDGRYMPVTDEEFMRLYTAAKMYQKRIKQEIYAFAV